MSVEGGSGADEQVLEHRLMQHFLQKAKVTENFPADMASLRLNEEQQYKDNMMLDVDFDERIAYSVNVAVFVVAPHGLLHNLARRSDLNGSIVEVFKCESTCTRQEMGVCRHDGKCTFKTMLQVRRVNADEKPFGKTLLIDGVHVKPYLNQNYEAGLAILRGMSHFWRKDTPVLLQFHKAHTDIMRHSTECFAKKDAMHLQPEVCQVVSSSFVVHLREFVSYMRNTSTWGDQEMGEVSSSIKSFVSARLTGFNLNEECVLCFEPLRHFPQVRLGCACGADGSVKGRVLHMKCADKWLREQANIWRDGYSANDRAAVGGPVGPSCPVCIQRLQGIPPRVTDLHARPLSPVEGLDVVRVINIADDALTFNLYEEMDRKMANIPITLARILHGEPDTERVDESMKCAILTYKKCVLFPSAQQLFACSGHERRRDCDFPGPATAVASNEDLHFMGVENYNNKVYYAALGCWLRWTRQFLRNGLAEA